MADDFTRLVTRANPAASHYQRTSDGYPPSAPSYNSHNSPQLLDPFFDDEDEGDLPDSAFVGLPTTHPKESQLHLPSQAAPLAGSSKLSLPAKGAPQGWTFDQDDPPARALSPPPRTAKKAPRRRWKFPWQKEKVLTGERVVALNNPDANADFLSNYVSTAKYNTVTFVPKFLFGWCLGSWRASTGDSDAFTRLQSNSRNMPIYSSFLPRVFNKSLASHPPTSGPLSHHFPSSSSLPPSKRPKKISSVSYLFHPLNTVLTFSR